MLISKGGIYGILNVVNKKVYIGSAVNLKNRNNTHISALNNNKHWNKYLQAAWNSYGCDNFEFHVLEYVEDKTSLTKREQHYINYFGSFDRERGYNLSPTAGSPLGVKHTEETKRKMGLTWKGRKQTKEHTAKIALALTGKKASDIARVNISKGLTGRKLSKEQLDKRKTEKWPHGYRCKCEECMLKKKHYMRMYHKMRKMKNV